MEDRDGEVLVRKRILVHMVSNTAGILLFGSIAFTLFQADLPSAAFSVGLFIALLVGYYIPRLLQNTFDDRTESP